MTRGHCRARPRLWHRLTRTRRRDLLIHSTLISLGASVLAACTGQWPYLPWQSSAARPLASVSPQPRATRKPKPPLATDAPVADAGGEVLARAEPAPASPTASSPPDVRPATSPAHQSRELIGLDQPEVSRVLGLAAEQYEQPPAMVWRYKNTTCELDLFFYLDLRSNRMRTLHYAVRGNSGDPANRQDCLESLRVARSN